MMATELYENIRELCKERGTKIHRIEKEMGFPENTISTWKEERRWMVYLPQVAKYLDVPIDRLFYAGTKTEKPAMERVVCALEDIDMDDQLADIVIEMVKTVSKTYRNP